MIFKKLLQPPARQKIDSKDPIDQLHSQFFGGYITLALVLQIILTLVNLFELFFRSNSRTPTYLVEDVLMGTLLAGLLLMNRYGFMKIAAVIFIGICLVSIPLVMPPELQIFSILLYIIPIQASSFIIRPNASIPTAILAVASYLFFQTFLPEIDLGNKALFLSVLCFLSASAWFVGHRLEKALKQSHQSELHSIELLEKNPSCIYMADGSHTGRWLYISPHIQDLLGITPEEWLSEDQIWRRLVHPADLPEVMAEIKRCQETRTPFQSEYRMLNRTGQVVWVSDYAVEVLSPNQPNCIQGVLLDTTSRKHAEQVRTAIYHISQAAFAADDLNDLYFKIHGVLAELMHGENFFIALYDAKTDILTFPYFVDEYDQPPAPVIAGHNLTEYVLRTGQAVFATAQECARLVAQGEITDSGTPSVDWLGVPLIVNNHTIGVMAVQSYSERVRFSQAELDILKFVSTQVAMVIERKRNDAALREINQLTSEVISGVNTGIIVYDEAARHLIWNPYMEQMSGLPKEAVVGQPAGMVFQYTDEIQMESLLDLAMTGTTSAIPDMEYALPGAGNSGWLAGYCGPHRNAQGEIIGAIAVINNITARKQTEEALRKAVNEKEVMMREIHHRVKNNLQVMSSLISLQAETIHDECTRAHFRGMQTRVRSMALVHEELYQSQDFSRVNLAEYVNKLTAGLMATYAINPNVNMHVNVADIFLGVDVAIPCGLMINELVTNAFKYAFPNQRTGEVCISVQELPNGMIRLQVRDNGIGMPADMDIYNTETLGMQLITILTRQLRGNLQVGWVGGTSFQIDFREPKVQSRGS